MKTFSRLLVISAALAAVALANAQAIQVSAHTSGNLMLNPGSGTGLSFNPGSFTNLIVLTNGVTPLSLSGTNLGNFSLTDAVGTYTGSFDLTVTFTVPTTTPGSAVYSAILKGAIRTTKFGDTSSVHVTFDDDGVGSTSTVGKSFTYVAADGTHGTLSMLLQRDYDVNIGQPAVLTGSLTATAVPGPAALASFGVGTLGMVRRRRAAKK